MMTKLGDGQQWLQQQAVTDQLCSSSSSRLGLTGFKLKLEVAGDNRDL